MRVLLDESMPRAFGPLLTGHEVRTVRQMRWQGTKNGELLRRAAAEGFRAVVTVDRSLEYQQDVAGMALGVVVLVACSNQIEDLGPLAPMVVEALGNLDDGQVAHVGTRGRG
jgi:hypothetical protein